MLFLLQSIAKSKTNKHVGGEGVFVIDMTYIRFLVSMYNNRSVPVDSRVTGSTRSAVVFAWCWAQLLAKERVARRN